MRSARLVRARVGLAVLLGLGLGFLVAPAAQAYPATVCSVQVTPRQVLPGHPVTVKGTSNKATNWTFKLKAAESGTGVKTQVARGYGKTFTHVFHAPKVKKTVRLVVTSSCNGGSTSVTVTPPGTGTGGGGGQHGGPSSSGGGILPNTGGPAWWLAALALLLLGGGTYAMRRQRRS